MSSTTTTHLNIPNSTSKGNTAHVFPNLTTGNLLSVGQLCDDDYTAIFDKDKVVFLKDNNIQFTGNRNSLNGMWYTKIPRTNAQSQQANFVLSFKPVEEAIRFLHAACFSPCISTWCKAIDSGFFHTWPGLTSAKVTKYLPHNPE